MFDFDKFSSNDFLNFCHENCSFCTRKINSSDLIFTDGYKLLQSNRIYKRKYLINDLSSRFVFDFYDNSIIELNQPKQQTSNQTNLFNNYIYVNGSIGTNTISIPTNTSMITNSINIASNSYNRSYSSSTGNSYIQASTFFNCTNCKFFGYSFYEFSRAWPQAYKIYADLYLNEEDKIIEWHSKNNAINIIGHEPIILEDLNFELKDMKNIVKAHLLLK